MKTILKNSILLFITLGVFLLPIQPSFEIKKDGQLALGVKTNEVVAEDYTNLFPGSTIKWLSSSSSSAEFDVNIVGNQSDWNKTEYIYSSQLGSYSTNENSTVLVVMENGNYVSSYDLSGEVRANTNRTGVIYFYSFIGPKNITGWKSVRGLAPGKTYTANFYVQSRPDGDDGGINLFGSTRKNYYKFGTGTTFSTGQEEGLLIGEDPVAPRPDDSSTMGGLNLKCGISSWFSVGEGSLYGCVAVLVWMVFEIVSFLASFAGKFLDFFVYYSTSSTSYTSNFITKGWGAVRDIANIFFIIALLYIAIKMILSLGDSHSKKLISTIIIVALLINFSLFVTQVVIDGSNILAKVFYNNIDQKYATGGSASGATGEKSISTGLMDKFDPEKILTQKAYDEEGGTTMFIIITLFLIAIIGYTAYIFFSVALLFVSRVIMLWFSMIFAPIAFASYTLPFDIPGLGHKEWWKNLFENAFLAPIFVFLLYIIVMFAGFLKEIVKYPENADIMQKFMGVVIPFILLMVLLKKAKEMAVKYAGEMGGAINKLGGLISGAAIGLGIGGMAALGQKTLGRASGAIGKNISGDTAVGRFWKNRFNDASKSSFSVAAIPGAGKLLSSIGVKDAKPKYANYEERVKAKDEQRKKRARELEVQPTEKEAIAVRREKVHVEKIKTDQATATEEAYTTEVDETTGEIAVKGHIDQNGDWVADKEQKNMNEIETDIKRFESKLSVAEKKMSEADKELKAEQGRQNFLSATERQDPQNIQKLDILQKEYKKNKDIKKQLVDYLILNGNLLNKLKEPIHHAEVELVKAENALSAKNKKRVQPLAENLEKRVFNTFQVGGKIGAERISDEIRIKTASENTEKKAPSAPTKHGH